MMGQSYTNTFSVSGGMFGEGYGGEFTLDTNLSETTFTELALNVSIANYQSGIKSIPYSSLTASYSYFITLYSRNRRMQALSLGGGVLAGYEMVNNGEVAVLTGDIDIIVSEHISLIIRTSEYFHANSDFGSFTNYTGLGLRYYFNK